MSRLALVLEVGARHLETTGADFSRLCLGVPIEVARNRPNRLMNQGEVSPTITKHNRKLPSRASALVKLKGRVFETFDKESQGPNLFSLKALLPVLMQMGMAMVEYGKILEKLFLALLRRETGFVEHQIRTRKNQALYILRALFNHSITCKVELCDPSEGEEFRNDLFAAAKRVVWGNEQFEDVYRQITQGQPPLPNRNKEVQDAADQEVQSALGAVDAALMSSSPTTMGRDEMDEMAALISEALHKLEEAKKARADTGSQ